MLSLRPLHRAPALLPAAFLLLLVLAVFSPLFLSGDFFWDDHVLLVDNPLIKSATGLHDIWLSTRNPDYFPLTSTSFWLEWRLWNVYPQGYHLTNILLHAGSTLLLWRILRRLKIPAAFLTAALFAIHPVNVESVSWIAERKNTLSMFFLCLTVWCFVRADITHRIGPYLLGLLFFLLALLSKTAVVMAPFLLLFLLFYRHRRWQWRFLLRVLPFFILSLVLGLVTIYFQYHNSIGDVLIRNDPLSSRIAIAGRAAWFYIAKVAFPFPITFNYRRWELPAQAAVDFLPLALLLAVWLVLMLIPRTRLAALALAAYILMLAPMLGLLNIFFMRYSLVSDHWQYHAMPIVLTLIVSTIIWLTDRFPRWTLQIAAALIIALLALDSATIANVYRTSETIWLDSLAHNPRAWLADNNLGQLYLTRARSDPAYLPQAIHYFNAVTRLQPDLAVGYVNLGNAFAVANDPAHALAAYQQGLAAPIASADERSLLFYNAGALLARQGDYAAAADDILHALALNPVRKDTYATSLGALANIAAQHHDDALAQKIRDALRQ